MEFCERCGSIMKVENGRAFCASCGHKSRKTPKIAVSEKIQEKEVIAVIKKGGEIYPIVDMRCPKCRNKKSYFWTMQTRASDESETKFYKCTKCEHTWRVYK